MTVNDSELSIMLKLAYDKITINGNERNNLKKFIENCIKIIKVPKNDSPTEMKEIMDDVLGIQMSTSRRQAIYDKLLVDKVSLNLV